MILHIPHSGTNTLGRKIEQFDIDKLTDWFTDELFFHENSDRMVQEISRFVCDVERFTDDKEDMIKVGQGICYTKGTNDNDILVKNKQKIIKDVYDVWHSRLNKLTSNALSYFPKVVVVDCHSFIDEDKNLPDFCIGTTEHTPQILIDNIVQLLNKKYSVAIDSPFSGSMTPTEYVNDANVIPIMIEVNKNLYLEGTNKNSNFINISKVVNEVLELISQFEIGE